MISSIFPYKNDAEVNKYMKIVLPVVLMLRPVQSPSRYRTDSDLYSGKCFYSLFGIIMFICLGMYMRNIFVGL